MIKNKQKITEEFISKAKKVHGDKYNYSLAEYVNAKTKIKIICSEHGIFEQIPNGHLAGGCRKCGQKQKNIDQRHTTEKFIEKARKIHGDKYDYSLVEYKDAYTKVKIICPIHGEFEQAPTKHANISSKNGCKECGFDKLKTNQEEFIMKVSEIHNNRYDYSLTKYVTGRHFIKIICPTHGEFQQKPNWHINGRGCPICNTSKGEIKINKFLTEHNINFIPQHKFDDCVNKNKLPFDFYLPDYNTIIEFDGKQHFEPIPFFGGEKHLKETQYNDNIKNKYCQQKGIKLIRIRYDEDILKILKASLN